MTEDSILLNSQDILADLRAENKLRRRKTLNSILEQIKSLQVLPKSFLVAKTNSSRKAIKLDSDDEEDNEDGDDLVSEGTDIIDQQKCDDEIKLAYGSIDNLVKSLVMSLVDPVEKCREIACECLSTLIEKCEKKTIARLLPLIIPTLVQRLAQPELIESSEEVRFLCMEFIELMIKKGRKELIPFIDDFLAIMMQTLSDPFHEVRIKSCEVTSLLAKTMPEVFHYNSERLVKPLCYSLNHQQSRVRKAMVECIGDVLQHGSHKPAEEFVPPLITRLFDSNPGVRKSTVSVVGNWMLDFTDRYSHFHRFLPVILTGLCDESPEVSELAENLWAKVGDKYLEENIQDYKDFVDFPAQHPKHYPMGVHRPNYGCRMLVHREVCKIIPGATHDIMDWQEQNRQKSAQLLYHLILHSEEKITMHVEPIFQCMFRACLDSNTEVVNYVLQAASLLGYFVPISTCWPLLSENLKSSPSEGCLAVTSSYLKGVDPEQLPPHLNDILELLSSPDICQTFHKGKLKRILSACETLLALAPQAVAEQASETMFRVLLVVASMCGDSEISERSQNAMDILKQFYGLLSVDDLFGLYSGRILEEISEADVEWIMNTPERLIFTAILTQAGSGVRRNMDIVLEILVNYLGPKRDPEVRLNLFTELAGILRLYSELELEDQNPQQAEQIQIFVKTITEDVLNKNLVWRAGRSAAALRAAALNCLRTILVGKLLNTETVVSLSSDIANGCIGLLDDQYQLNRLFSAKCLGELATNCEGQIDILLLNRIYPELLKRMDDETKEVRLAASKAISQIFSTLPPDYTVDHFKAYFEHVVGAMIVHLDDRDEEIQDAVFDTLLTIGSTCSEAVITKCEKFKSLHRSPKLCELLVTELSS